MPPPHALRPSLPEGTEPGVLPAVECLVAAVGRVTVHGTRAPIVVADYGASTGRHSLLPVARAVEALRGRVGPRRSVLVVHTDRPDNDFTRLFRTLADDPASYLRDDPATFSAAVGRSHYAQVLPSDSVTLGWAATVTRSLRRAPAAVPDHVHAGLSADRGARAAFGAQAAGDWLDLVAFRGRELAPGGRLVVLTDAADDDGGPGLRPLLDATAAALSEVVHAGLLTDEEAHRLALPAWAHTEADLTAPFMPSGRFENLSVEQLQCYRADDAVFARFQRDGDAHAFGARWAELLREVILPPLLESLTDRADPRAAQVADRLAIGVAQRLADAPQPMRLPMARMVLVKRGP